MFHSRLIPVILSNTKTNIFLFYITHGPQILQTLHLILSVGLYLLKLLWLESSASFVSLMKSKRHPLAFPNKRVTAWVPRCAVNMRFLFATTYYLQDDGVAVTSLLFPVIGSISKAQLETARLQGTDSLFDHYNRSVSFVVSMTKIDLNLNN